MKKLSLHVHADTAGKLAALKKLPHGTRRAAKLVEILERDLAALPLDVDPPAVVSEALDSFRVSCAWLKNVAANVATAKTAAASAASEDVDAAAAAMRAGSPVPKTLRQSKAGDAAAAAEVAAEAAERVIMEGFEHVIAAVRETYPDWRRQLVASAPAAHSAAAAAMRSAAAAAATAVAGYSAVTALDSQILARYQDLRRTVDAERRQGIDWYQATHDAHRPLSTVKLPDPSGRRGATVAFKLADVLAAVTAALEAPADFPAGEWVPPSDPAHDEALAASLDLSAAWVRRAVARSFGSDVCALCGQPGADKVIDGRGLVPDGGLGLVHARCEARDRNDPKMKARRKREERIDNYKREGFPPSPDEQWRSLDD